MRAPLLNIELARRIELAEAQVAADGAETMSRLRPGSGAAVERIAGGFAVYSGPNSPTTQAVGLGLDGHVSEEEFDRLEEFYRSRGEPVRVEACPLADHFFIAHFGKRGYRVTEFSNVMALTLEGASDTKNWPGPPPGLTIERVGHDQADLWTLTVAQGFAENFPVIEEILEVMKVFALSPNVECYLARMDGKVAGGGTLAIRDGVAGLFGASTLVAFRNRGVQTALLHAPLAGGCGGLRPGGQPRAAGQHFAAQYRAAGFPRAVHAREV